MLHKTFGVPGASSKELPALWTAVNAGTGELLLRPVCAAAGALHVVGAEARLHDGKLDVSQLTKAEARWLDTVAAAVHMCTHSVAVANVGKGGRRKPHRLAGRLAGIFEALGKPLVPLWQPTSVAPLWVCPKHSPQQHRKAATSGRGGSGRGGGRGGRGGGGTVHRSLARSQSLTPMV